MTCPPRIERVLVATTRHMPDIDEDLSLWQWGEELDTGIIWFFAYEEDCEIGGKSMPQWLFNLCSTARATYGCEWVLLDPAGEEVPGLPLYDPSAPATAGDQS